MSVDVDELLAPNIGHSMMSNKLTKLFALNRQTRSPDEADGFVEVDPANLRFLRPVVASTKRKDRFVQVGCFPEVYERREPFGGLGSRKALSKLLILGEYVLLSFLTAFWVQQDFAWAGRGRPLH